MSSHFGLAFGLTAAAATAGFVGYCIYFDRKRHADPLFKHKLRESALLIYYSLIAYCFTLIPFSLAIFTGGFDSQIKAHFIFPCICTNYNSRFA